MTRLEKVALLRLWTWSDLEEVALEFQFHGGMPLTSNQLLQELIVWVTRQGQGDHFIARVEELRR